MLELDKHRTFGSQLDLSWGQSGLGLILSVIVNFSLHGEATTQRLKLSSLEQQPFDFGPLPTPQDSAGWGF